MAFVDLENAFDRVIDEVVRRALRSLGVNKCLVSVVQSMYRDAITVVRVKGRDSKACGLRVRGLKVRVHQESVLSPLCFVIELEAL